MIQTINQYMFEQAFKNMNRDNNFSYEGKKTLFEYLEQLEEETDKPIELDVIALCCEYAEYKSLAEFQKDYDDSYKSIQDIEDETTVIRMGEIDGQEAFIIAKF